MEIRNSNDWNLQYEACRLLGRDPKALATTLWAVSDQPNLWEAGFGSWTLTETVRESRAQVLESIPSGVVFGNQDSIRAATNKGLTARTLPAPWLEALEAVEGPTTKRELGEWAKKGVDLLPTVTPEVLQRVSHYQTQITQRRLARGAEPVIRAFSQHPSATTKLLGFADSTGIYLNHELGGELLDQTILEELAHFHSGCQDFTREFQEWLIRYAIRKEMGEREINS